MAAANTGGFRLGRCPKCFNVLPEPPDVTVYKCGVCNTTLRAKTHVSNGQHVATKQVRQDSDDYSVATSVSNGVPQNKDPGFSDTAMDSSCTPDAPSTETEYESNSMRSNENGDVVSTEKNAMEVENTANKEDCNFDGQNTNGRMEGPSDLIHPNGNGAHIDSDKEENNNVQPSAENSEACKVREDGDMDCSLNASEYNVPSPRYRWHRAYSCCHSGQMEMRPCPHECCHSCRPPCYRSWKQEPALPKPPVKEIKRRPPLDVTAGQFYGVRLSSFAPTVSDWSSCPLISLFRAKEHGGCSVAPAQKFSSTFTETRVEKNFSRHLRINTAQMITKFTR